MRNIIAIVLASTLLFQSGSAWALSATDVIDAGSSIVGTSDYINTGFKPYTELDVLVSEYKSSGMDYQNELETQLRKVYAKLIQNTANSDGRQDIFKKLVSKEPMTTEDMKWFLNRTQYKLIKEYIPEYEKERKTYSQNFCKDQVEREKKINEKIDEIRRDGYDMSSILTKLRIAVSNSRTKEKVIDYTTKLSAFTNFNQRIGCDNYDGRALGKGQLVGMKSFLNLINTEKFTFLQIVREVRGKLNVAKTDKERNDLFGQLCFYLNELIEGGRY